MDNEKKNGIKEGEVSILRLIIGSVILVLGAIGCLVAFHRISSLEGVGIMGVGILFTVLVGGNVLAGSFDLSTAEVRRAISIAMVSVFFAILGRANTIVIKQSIITPVLEKFWWIIITVVVFYFGGRTLEKLKKGGV